MSTKYTFGLTWNSGASNLSQDIAVTDSAAIAIDEAIASNATDFEIACVLATAEIAGLWMECDQAVTVETNDATAADDTITLRANEPLAWYTNCYYTSLLTADVTALFVTCATGTTGTFKMRCLYDATP
ncbi:MAG TPA: hypothetical protein VMW48_08830 [Vicinamibacterales bacterium]|nr:hypothetical protein [Vicinamibacterales bacterium]